MSDLLDAALGVQPDVVDLRRAIHREPEIGLDLPKTQAKVLEALAGLGLDITTGESTTSVVADLRGGGGDGPTILLRADMDALPLTEDSGEPFSSEIAGAMHATATRRCCSVPPGCCPSTAISCGVGSGSCSSPARRATTARSS
jgi:metal-dependent amidase/aminoacylase/carboxypeptidase family protein